MQRLEPLAVPLTGNRLIEASAGTGKTYTITTLFLRLLVERSLRVDQVLVVTFTKAATAELRDRLRQRLRAAVTAFGEGDGSGDEVLEGLVAAAPDRGATAAHLAAELRRFDEAAVFTIHGFCQRVLAEHAFESGVVFDAELVTDSTPLLLEVVQDFWAREVYDAPERFARYLVDRNVSPDALLGLAADAAADPELRVVPPRFEAGLEAAEEVYRAAHREAAALWAATGDALGELMLTSPVLKRTSWRLPTTQRRLEGLQTYFSADDPPTELAVGLDRFTPDQIAQATKKGQAPPAHPLFEACAALVDAQAGLRAALEARLLGLRLDLMAYVRQELRRRRERSGTLSYDDLLHQVERALGGAGGAHLAAVLRRRYRAALIDEFQDTDPVQSRIFGRIFTEDETLFLIGDPKQAIYGFRRADIFTYLAAGDRVRAAHGTAAAEEGGCYTLGVNWRSDPSLIAAVNRIHERARNPFIDERIGFEAVRPAPQRSDGLAGTAHHARPFELLFCDRAAIDWAPDKPINKSWAAAELPRRVAAEIAGLLASDTTLGGRPVQPGDVAVLIRRNAEAEPLQAALRQLGVPAVLHSDASVFLSDEAESFERVLRALAEPRSDGLVAAALATPLFGRSGEQIQALTVDEQAWQRWTDRFAEWHRLWRRRGFMLAFRQLAERERAPERLLGLPDGERRLTNLLHLAELLHRAAVQERLGPAGLTRWLGQARAEADVGVGDDSRQLRMESDARAVQILTMHKAKGLEFPVVYCPFLWDAGPQPRTGHPVRFHDPAADHQVTLDLGSEALAEHQAVAAQELLAERLRITYVALTRARHRAVVVWGAFRGAERSGLAHLLHQGEGAGDDLVAETQRRVARASDAELLEDLDRLVAGADGVLAVRPLGEGAAERAPLDEASTTPLAARRFGRSLDGHWRVASFSALAAGGEGGVAPELEDRDVDQADAAAAAVLPGDAAEARVRLHDFPRGARAGTLLHTLFEQIDFTRPETVGPVTGALLPRYGVDLHWAPTVEAAVGDALQTGLDAAGQVRLADVGPERRLVELEFMLPVAQPKTGASPLTAGGLAALFDQHGPPALAGYADALARLSFAEVRGYLRGFIDLVFEHSGRYYVLDYKSNHLGPHPSDYDPPALARAMVAHHYPLQYHLYTLALHRYLAARLPGYDYDRSFGGVFYLFLRGLSPTRPGHAVFADRPSRSLLQGLSDLVDGVGGAS